MDGDKCFLQDEREAQERNPVRVWRQHREMSQAQLAQIETGKREGTLSLCRSLADALDIKVEPARHSWRW